MTRALATLATLAVIATPAHALSERSVPSVTVKAGDTLAEIAKGSGYPWTRWAFVNDLADPDLLHVGDVLLVPRRDGRRWKPRPTPKVSRSWTGEVSSSVPSGRSSSSASSSGSSGPTASALTVTSTAYCLTGTMANGQRVYDGAVAVNGVPFGTRYKVLSGPYAGRVLTVADRIGSGSQFDIAMPGRCSDAIAYGRRTIQVVAQ